MDEDRESRSNKCRELVDLAAERGALLQGQDLAWNSSVTATSQSMGFFGDEVRSSRTPCSRGRSKRLTPNSSLSAHAPIYRPRNRKGVQRNDGPQAATGLQEPTLTFVSHSSSQHLASRQMPGAAVAASQALLDSGDDPQSRSTRQTLGDPPASYGADRSASGMLSSEPATEKEEFCPSGHNMLKKHESIRLRLDALKANSNSGISTKSDQETSKSESQGGTHFDSRHKNGEYEDKWSGNGQQVSGNRGMKGKIGDKVLAQAHRELQEQRQLLQIEQMKLLATLNGSNGVSRGSSPQSFERVAKDTSSLDTSSPRVLSRRNFCPVLTRSKETKFVI
jgi:hypothetical protein